MSAVLYMSRSSRLSPEQETQAAGILASIRRAVDAARSRQSGFSDALGGYLGFGSSTAGQSAALDAVMDHLARAESIWLDWVRAGEKSFDWWLEAVEVERAAVAQYQDTAESYGLIASARGALGASVDDVKALAPVAFDAAKWGAVALVAVAVLYVVSFAKAVRA